MSRLFALFCLSALLTSCSHNEEIKPNLTCSPPASFWEGHKAGFQPLSPEEKKSEWGKELFIATHLARQQDLFGAATGFKRAQILLNDELPTSPRSAQIEYDLILSYWLANKYAAVIELFENSTITVTPANFVPYDTLLIVLYDSYLKIKEPNKAVTIFNLIQQHSPDLAKRLTLYQELSSANLTALEVDTTPEIQDLMHSYHTHKKSANKARLYNALLPGAGYLYIGQAQSAFTSLLLNALFIAATYEFAKHGQTAAAIISGGFELGWYVGGIIGGGLAAEQYNSKLYNRLARDVMLRKNLFPILMLDYAF